MNTRSRKASEESTEMVKRMNEVVKKIKKTDTRKIVLTAPPNQSKKAVAKKKAYLTKRVLTRATGKATKGISIEAMLLKGYVVQVENGWVIKIGRDGKKEKISRLNRANTSKKVVLD
jgi:hypothetical protein